MTTQEIDESLEDYALYVSEDLAHKGEDEEYPMEYHIF
jgi:hypothetical protein